jgi:hypothetical protein
MTAAMYGAFNFVMWAGGRPACTGPYAKAQRDDRFDDRAYCRIGSKSRLRFRN